MSMEFLLRHSCLKTLFVCKRFTASYSKKFKSTETFNLAASLSILRQLCYIFHFILWFQVMVGVLQTVVRKHLGDEIPPVYDLSKNVSFILQNSHFSVSYPRAFMPNVAEIACIHCKPSQPLPNVRLFFYDELSEH